MVDRTFVGFSPFCLARVPCLEDEREGRMPAPERALFGDELLDAVTSAMVAFHERYYHRMPVTAKSMMLDDEVLLCVLGGVYTDVEKTMIELQRGTVVQDTRSAFQNVMEQRFIAAVERLSGREVLMFMSDHHIGPDIEIELFVLSPQDGEPDPV